MSRIPNVFHFVFGLKKQSEPFHLAFYLCIESCYAVNRPERIYFYYHHEPWGRYWDLARRRVTPVRVPLDSQLSRFQYADPDIARYRYAHLSDFVRLERLLERGGVYADIDTIFVNPFPPRLWDQPFVLGREPDVTPAPGGAPRPSLCNALIMAEPGAEFGQLWLSQMREAFDGSWSSHSTLLPEQLRQQHPELIHVEPQRTFYKHAWTPEGIATLLEGLDTDFTGVVSMHLWSHLWWSRRRRDFSSFHAGRINERAIARIDTTYNVVARRYLPAPLFPARAVGLAGGTNPPLWDVRLRSAERVSVVIPTRDRPRLVAEAIESVLRQSHPVDQIVVVDDGTTNRLVGQVAMLPELSSRIDLLRRETPGGPAAARNLGLAHASGDYVLFLDDDDLIHPHLVAEGLARLAASPTADMAVFRYRCFWSAGELSANDDAPVGGAAFTRRAQTDRWENPVPSGVLEQRPASAFLRYLIPINSCFIRRSAVGNAQFPEALRQGEDTYFWISLARAGRRFVPAEPMYAYVRRHPGNLTRSRLRYAREIQACYEQLLADGLLEAADDAFLAHLKLLWFKCLTLRPGRLRHLHHVVASPELLARELMFWAGNLGRRTGLLPDRKSSWAVDGPPALRRAGRATPDGWWPADARLAVSPRAGPALPYHPDRREPRLSGRVDGRPRGPR